jgi:hypothetical protein
VAAAATTVPLAAAAAAASNPAAQGAGAAADPKNFGLSTTQLHSQPAGPSSIQARVYELYEDAVLHSFVVLDNGQTWQSLEGELNLNKGDLVTIRRAALGSFMLESAKKAYYHVRRVH